MANNKDHKKTPVDMDFVIAAQRKANRAKQTMLQKLPQEREYRSGFEERLYQRWKQPLDLLEATILFLREEANTFISKHQPQAKQDNDRVFAVITTLLGVAYPTALEICTLLRSGHATGALARWRTLHEASVIGKFVHIHGAEVAQRYLDRVHIDTRKLIAEFHKVNTTLDSEAAKPDLLTKLEEKESELRGTYEAVFFDKDYGWAAPALTNKARPSFYDLEKDVNLNDLRPWYKLACGAIHPSYMGITLNIQNPFPTSTSQSGPSQAGLTDPAQLTLRSLIQSTINLLNTRVDDETGTTVDAVVRIWYEVCELFHATEQELLAAGPHNWHQGGPPSKP